MIHGVLSGDTALLAEGFPAALVVATRGWETRSISEPITEGAVRGPRDGFVETLQTNIALLRRRVKSPDLRIETMIAGRATRTDVAVAYIRGTVNEGVLEEVRRRLGRINTDSILESGYIEEFIRDHPYTPFPLVEHSERPDKITAALLEGRVAIMVDGTPFVLMVPVVFLQLFQASEDYYMLYYFGTVIRWGRFLKGFLFNLYLPSLYVAVTTIHHELLPTSLALALAGAREGVPYPALVEALLMELTFEALREAGIRLPRPVGQAVSIVGALVIGDAAVRAGLVSPAMVIVVAFTGIASFSVPSYKLILTLRLLQFPMMTIAAVLGLPGVIMASVVLLAHLVSLRSFGVPYLSPVAPYSRREGLPGIIPTVTLVLLNQAPRLGELSDRMKGAGTVLEDGRITGRQFTTLIFIIITSVSVLQIPPLLLGLAGQDSWLSVVIAVVIDGIVAAVLYFLGLKYPGKTFIQYSEDILGRIPGKLVAVLFIQFFLFMASLSLWAIGIFLTTIMTETPLAAFVITGALVSSYVAGGGLEVLARMSEVITSVCIIALLTLLALLIPEMDLSELLPLFQHGAGQITIGSLLPASWFGVCIIMAMFMAYHHRPERTFVVKMIGVVLGATVLILLLTANMAVFGAEYATVFNYPIFMLVRQVSLADILERLEVLWVTIWLFAGFITISSLHYASALGTAQLLGLRNYRPLVLPLGTAIASFSHMIIPSAIIGTVFTLRTFPLYLRKLFRT